MAGPAPFKEFYVSILPTLGRPSSFAGNQSLPGLLVRIYGRPLIPKIAQGLTLLRFFTFTSSLLLIFTLKKKEWNNPVHVFAGASLLISWLMIFSPISWEHWPIFLCPVWGWLLWEAREKGIQRVLAVFSLILMYLPSGILQVEGFAQTHIVLPEPFNSTQLIGVILLYALSFWRLSQEASSKPLTSEESSEMGKLKKVK